MTALAQLPLLNAAIVGVEPIELADANDLLVRWEHKLGACRRPFASEAFALLVDYKPIAVAISASAVSATVAGYRRQEVVELARLCSTPDVTWANRVLLRVWREVLAPRWACWPVKAAVSYSHNALHAGSLYRHDGWSSVRDDCGSSGGGSWSKTRSEDDARAGAKTLWVWRYDHG